MIVRTLDRQFAVLQVLRSDENEEILVCQDLEDQALYPGPVPEPLPQPLPPAHAGP